MLSHKLIDAQPSVSLSRGHRVYRESSGFVAISYVAILASAPAAAPAPAPAPAPALALALTPGIIGALHLMPGVTLTFCQGILGGNNRVQE